VSNGTIAINAATSAAAGIIEIATSAEVQAGTDATKAVVPSTMKGSLGYSSRFISTEQVMVTAAVTSVAHGLADTPTAASYYLVAQTSNNGYSIGDRIFSNDIIRRFASNALETYGLSLFANASAVGVIIGVHGLNIIPRSTGSVTGISFTDWKIVLQAWA